MNIILFDDQCRNDLLPLTHTRPVAEIRCGILTVRERWEMLSASKCGTLTEPYLQQTFPREYKENILYINSAVLGGKSLWEQINQLDSDQILIQDDCIIAFRSIRPLEDLSEVKQIAKTMQPVKVKEKVMRIEKLWHIFNYNEKAIEIDFAILTEARQSQKIPPHVTAMQPERIFIEEGAIVNPCILNPAGGYIYLAKESEVMEGCLVRGSLALGTHAVLKMGAKVYGATTIGPYCKVGGEIANVIFFNYSNKGHDGYLGNSVIGDWCNLGADTNSSNLKNNYSNVSIWNENNNTQEKTDQQFLGLIMADHSKCGINTMFNTGTVVSVSCNIYGGSFPPKFLPAFSWGGSDGLQEYKMDKAVDTANKMMGRRNQFLSENDIEVLNHIFTVTQSQREHFI